MANSNFKLSDFNTDAQISRLSDQHLKTLEKISEHFAAASFLAPPTGSKINFATLLQFILPLIELGLDREMILKLVEKVPADFQYDHREIYFDFRLNRWLRHIEPPTLAECLDEYLEHSESKEMGLKYLHHQWKLFLKKHDAI